MKEGGSIYNWNRWYGMMIAVLIAIILILIVLTNRYN
jgi:hypothetical protein